ncbi:aldo/keto reductase [Kribbella sp. NPDC056345]|uniref:aldo/keto reductase n=1 Tax=Kribbella sp. NPDC056345 TaxID=3345789 RepID=UPI0035E01FC8
MKYRPLGRTGVQVSELTLGSMLFDTSTASGLIDQALDAGVNALDTANVYGQGESERALGAALAKNGRRDQIVLSSKFHVRVGDDPNAAGSSRRHIVDQVDKSLQRLGVDHLDIYYIHRPTTEVPIDETLRALDDLVTAGKILYVGTSGFAAWQLLESLWAAKEHHLARPVVEQTAYSLVDRRPERELLPMAQTYGVGVTIWSPLAGGLLTGKYRAGVAPDARFDPAKDDEWTRKHFTPAADAVVDGLIELAKVKDCTPTQLALAWLLSRPGVSSVVLGARNSAQLTEQLAAADVELTEEDLGAVDALVAPGRATVPYFLDDSYADFRPHLHRW